MDGVSEVGAGVGNGGHSGVGCARGWLGGGWGVVARPGAGTGHPLGDRPGRKDRGGSHGSNHIPLGVTSPLVSPPHQCDHLTGGWGHFPPSHGDTHPVGTWFWPPRGLKLWGQRDRWHPAPQPSHQHPWVPTGAPPSTRWLWGTLGVPWGGGSSTVGEYGGTEDCRWVTAPMGDPSTQVAPRGVTRHTIPPRRCSRC